MKRIMFSLFFVFLCLPLSMYPQKCSSDISVAPWDAPYDTPGGTFLHAKDIKYGDTYEYYVNILAESNEAVAVAERHIDAQGNECYNAVYFDRHAYKLQPYKDAQHLFNTFVQHYRAHYNAQSYYECEYNESGMLTITHSSPKKIPYVLNQMIKNGPLRWMFFDAAMRNVTSSDEQSKDMKVDISTLGAPMDMQLWDMNGCSKMHVAQLIDETKNTVVALCHGEQSIRTYEAYVLVKCERGQRVRHRITNAQEVYECLDQKYDHVENYR